MTNSTLRGNSAISGFGGGIYNTNSVTVTNGTLSDSSAVSGGGIYNENASALRVKNTIIANSISGGNCAGPGAYNSSGYNISSDTSCIFANAGDLTNTDPLLGQLQDNGGPTETHEFLIRSPAIDAGNLDCPQPASDQRGNARPQGGRRDIGAFELD